MAWGAGARLEGLAHGEALPFTIVRVMEHDSNRRRAPRRPGRKDLCGNQMSGAPRHRRDVVLVTAYWLISTQARTQPGPVAPPNRTSRVYPATKKV
jgi:hypothetical protein